MLFFCMMRVLIWHMMTLRHLFNFFIKYLIILCAYFLVHTWNLSLSLALLVHDLQLFLCILNAVHTLEHELLQAFLKGYRIDFLEVV